MVQSGCFTRFLRPGPVLGMAWRRRSRQEWGSGMESRKAQCERSIWLCPFLRAGLLLAGALLAWTAAAGAEGRAAQEFEIKAVFLYNFARFVEWPADAFADEQSPLVIGVLGADPFGYYLDRALRDEKVNGRPVVVERYRWVGEIETCHVLFISGSEGPRADHILGALREQPILTVCDTHLFARKGAMIHLVMDRQRVRIRINLEAARRVGLVISAKLLRTAEIVGNRTGR